MLTLKEAIQQRRSVRKFKPDNITSEMISEILEAARLAPSASNMQPWRFAVVRNQSIREALAEICWGQKFIAAAPVDIVCFGDRNLYSREQRNKRRQELQGASSGNTALSSRFTDPAFREYLKSHPLPPPQDTITSIVANTFIAIEHMLLMATALGLGSCWVGGFTEWLKINELFTLDENHIPIAVIAIGYPEGELPKAKPRRSMDDIIIKTNDAV